MKKLYIILIAILLYSCEGDLNLKVYHDLSTDNFPQDEEDYNMMVTGVYALFRADNAWYRYSVDPQSRLILGELGTEELTMAWSWCNTPHKNFDWNPTYDLLYYFYDRMVPSVTEATALIGKLQNSDLEDEDLKNRYIAETKCCRAFWIYDLEGFYGPPPVVLDVDAALNPTVLYYPPRLSSDSLLNFLEKDLLEAIDILPVTYSSSSDYGRFTKGAAETLLLKLYMRHGEFQKAIDLSGDIMELGYKLEDDYAMIWDINNEQNAETIFCIPCVSQEHTCTNLMRTHVVPADYVSPAGNAVVAYGGYTVPWTVWDQFDSTDVRRETLVKDYYIKKNGVLTLVDGRTTGRLRNGAMPLKYSEDPNCDGLYAGNDIVLLRYADVLLLRAEALNEVNGPNQESIDLINQIRDRAFNSNSEKEARLSDFADKDTLNSYILKERLFEFCMEGERREDLKRQGKYVQFARDRGVTGAEDYEVIYPIPSHAIIEGEGHIQQNEGY